MTMTPKLSIIIPTYNYAQFLPRTLNSIADQTSEKVEIIIVNDGSTDNTEQILQEYIASRQLNLRVTHQTNQGPSAARNVGITQAQGDYLLFLDADDELLPDVLLSLLESLQSNRDKDAFILGHVSCDIHGKIKPHQASGLGRTAKQNFLRLLNKKITMMNGTVVLKRQALNGLKFSEDLNNYEDLVFYLQVVSSLQCQVLDFCLSKINHHPNSQRSRLQLDECMVKVSVKALLAYDGLPKDISALSHQFASSRYLSIFRQHFLNGAHQQARMFYLKALREYPLNLFKWNYLKKFIRAF